MTAITFFMAAMTSCENTLYSQTSNKQPAKMHRVSTSSSLMGGGCLQESNHWGSLPSQSQDSSTLLACSAGVFLAGESCLFMFILL